MAGNPEKRAVAIAIQKGGMGKSFIARELTHTLARRNHDVLLIDLDPDGHLTTGLGYADAYNDEDRMQLGDILLETNDVDADEVRDLADPLIEQTEWGFDLIPAAASLEQLDQDLRNVNFRGSDRLGGELVRPLMQADEYDYVIIDTAGSASKLLNNAIAADGNLLVPITPGNEALSGLMRTRDRVIKPARKYIDLDVLAYVPNRLSDRIDHNTKDRTLLENLNRRDPFAEKVPSFARITSEEWDAIDAGEMDSPTPGLRERTAVTYAYGQKVPLAEYDPECDQLEHFETLADVVENGGVTHG